MNCECYKYLYKLCLKKTLECCTLYSVNFVFIYLFIHWHWHWSAIFISPKHCTYSRMVVVKPETQVCDISNNTIKAIGPFAYMEKRMAVVSQKEGVSEHSVTAVFYESIILSWNVNLCFCPPEVGASFPLPLPPVWCRHLQHVCWRCCCLKKLTLNSMLTPVDVLVNTRCAEEWLYVDSDDGDILIYICKYK